MKFITSATRLTTLLLLTVVIAACQVNSRYSTEDGSGQQGRIDPTPPGQPTRVRATSAPASPSTIATSEESEEALVYHNLWQRIGDNLSLSRQYEHKNIDAELSWLADNQRYVDRFAQQAAPFLYEIVEAVEQRGLPLDVALLPVIESAFDPEAYSSEQAAGLWQFMPRTAHSYGLKADWWYDGRRDPLASTRAALDYLEFLRDEFDGNWLLALAAYNAGEGSVRRAVRRSGASNETVDFWSLRLPLETRGHVPRLLAVGRLIANPDAHGISLPELPNEPFLEVVNLDFQIDLSLAAQLASLDEAILRTLNAGYLRWATHPDYPQTVVLPREQAASFREAVSGLPIDQRVSWDRYEIRRGDSLGAIAQRFATSVEVLQAVNNLSGTRIIAGRSLLIPRAGTSIALGNTGASPEALDSATPAPSSYRVRRGDSLWRIARRFDLRASDIASWNNLTLESVLHPGQLLALQPGQLVLGGTATYATVYAVVRGDSLDRIARNFEVDVDDLATWNDLNPESRIYPGQTLIVRATAADLN
jgi:membrane-bound lytic murein transglycosylase D